MGCFVACFGSSEVEKSRKRSRRIQPRDRRFHVSKPVQQGSSSSRKETANPQVLGTWEKPEEQLSLRKRKKVTFDSNVKVYEPDLAHEEAEHLLESESYQKQEKKLAKYYDPIQHKPSIVDNHVPPSYGTYPPNHRYQSCNYYSNEEDEVLDYADSDADDEWVGEEEEEEDDELSEEDEGEECCTVHPVLNPVENLTQWKAAKARGALNLKLEKENSTGFNGDLKSKTDQSNKFQQEFAVDASLSNWLISSKTRR